MKKIFAAVLLYFSGSFALSPSVEEFEIGGLRGDTLQLSTICNAYADKFVENTSARETFLFNCFEESGAVGFVSELDTTAGLFIYWDSRYGISFSMIRVDQACAKDLFADTSASVAGTHQFSEILKCCACKNWVS